MTRYRTVHGKVLACFILLAGSLFTGVYAQQHTVIKKSPPRYPTYSGRRLEIRAGRNGDLGGDIPADRELSQRDREYLLEIADFLVTKGKDPVLRKRAAQHLGFFGHRYGIPALLAVLRDESDHPRVRMSCMKELSMIRDKRVVRALIDDGLGNSEPGIGRETVYELNQFVGHPPQLHDVSYLGSCKHPPKDQAEREKYLEIWRQWWEKHRKDAKLNRAQRLEY